MRIADPVPWVDPDQVKPPLWRKMRHDMNQPFTRCRSGLLMISHALSFRVVQAPEDSRVRPGEVFHASASEALIIGRLPPAELCLPDRSVSRQHVRLSVAQGVWHAQNISSHNGLFIDGARVEPGAQAPLPRHGARLQVGAVVLAWEPSAETEPFTQPLSVSHAPARASGAEVLLAIERDGDHASVFCDGKLVPMKPTSAVILHTLACQPGTIVHAWDLFDALGDACDLAQAVSAIRRPLRQLIEAGTLDAERLRALIAEVSVADDAPMTTPEQLARRLITSRRGQGYALLLPSRVVHTSLAG